MYNRREIPLGFFIDFGFHQCIMKVLKHNNMNTHNVIGEIFPVFCKKNMLGMYDYRFCFLPYESNVDQRLEKLQPFDEGYVLLNNKNSFVGVQNHLGSMQIVNNAPSKDGDNIYYLSYVLNPSTEHPLSQAYAFAQANNCLKGYTKFVEQSIKIGLKLVYHRKKTAIKFDEHKFVSRHINKQISEHTEIHAFYSSLVTQTRFDQSQTNELFYYLFSIGSETASTVPLSVFANVN
jgi:hypothetical protein